MISLCGVICGADDWSSIARFCESKEAWFKKFLSLPSGIPSHDTFQRIFSLIDPEQFNQCFYDWTKSLSDEFGDDIVAIDGKSLRHSFKNKDIAPVHLVNAWSSKNKVTLAQVKVEGKSNEITAIPKLLELLELDGCIVTLDAMGCQRSIVEKIINKGSDYNISLKGNQGNLHKEVAEYLATPPSTIKVQSCETIDGGEHGRLEAVSYTHLTLPTTPYV